MDPPNRRIRSNEDPSKNGSTQKKLVPKKSQPQQTVQRPRFRVNGTEVQV